MKRFPRFSPAVVASVLLVVSAAVVRCIPNPDLSGLPPYDGGLSSEDTGAPVSTDANIDVSLGSDDSGAEAAPVDSATPVGTVSGIVIDYTEGNGKGVVPGATVTVSFPGNPSASAPAPVTTDANGLFTIPGVQAGVALEVGVSKPTDLVRGIAYSTTYLVVGNGVPANQTVSVFPVLHEGCYQNWVLPGSASGDAAANQPVTLQNATCPGGVSRPGAYAQMQFDGASFKDPVTNSLYSQVIRVEMIPLAYPQAAPGVPDLSWAVGLPGVTTPPGLLGAAEYRVVKSDPGQTDDGEPLALNNPTADPVTISVPVYAPPAAQVATYSYGTTAGTWGAETTANASAVQGTAPLQYINVQVPHLTWWAVTTGAPSATCVTGTLQAGGALANVLVHATGVNYLGSSTGVTNSAGLFCLDVATVTADGGGAQLSLTAEAIAGGVPVSATTSFAPSPIAGATCATPTSCTSLSGGAITLTPSLTCVSGTIEEEGGAPPSPLNVAVVSIPGVNYALSAGIQQTAYAGQITLGANGSFCALAPPGSEINFPQPASTNPNCQAPPKGDQPIQVLSGTAAPACSAGGCADAGAIQFSCNPGG